LNHTSIGDGLKCIGDPRDGEIWPCGRKWVRSVRIKKLPEGWLLSTSGSAPRQEAVRSFYAASFTLRSQGDYTSAYYPSQSTF